MVQRTERASFAAAAVAALVALAVAPTEAITTNAPSVDGGWFRGCVWSPPGLSAPCPKDDLAGNGCLVQTFAKDCEAYGCRAA